MELSDQLHTWLYVSSGAESSLWYPLNKRCDGAQSQEVALEKRKILASLGNEPQFIGCPADSLVIMLVGIMLCPQTCIF
jgi:hypothetical protein